MNRSNAANDEIAMDIRLSRNLMYEEMPEDERSLLFKRMIDVAERELDKSRVFIPVTGVDPMILANRIVHATKLGKIIPVDLSGVFDDVKLIDESEIANVT